MRFAILVAACSLAGGQPACAAEFQVVDRLALDGSAKAVSGGSGGLSALCGLAAGFGVKAYGYSLDYAITPFGELGNVQRLSLGARF